MFNIFTTSLFHNTFAPFVVFCAIAILTFSPFQSSANTHDVHWADYQEQLTLIDDIKKYCRNELGMTLGSQFYTEWEARDGLLQYVYVSEKNKIAVPKGLNEYYYFGTDRSAALRMATEFDAKGFHTLVYQTAGTSATLLNKALMSYSLEAIAVIVFHEALHVHLRLQNKNIPLAIEEAAADVFAKQITVQYLRQQKVIKKKPLKQILKTMERIYKTINMGQDKIEENTSSSPKVYSSCQQKIKKALKKGDVYQKTRFTYPINNAYFVRNSYYCEHYFTLDKLYAKVGNTKDFVNFISGLPNSLDTCLMMVNSKLSNFI